MDSGVPVTTACTWPEITIVSPNVYDDLSILVVTSAAVGGEGDGVTLCAKMGIDNAERDRINIVKMGV